MNESCCCCYGFAIDNSVCHAIGVVGAAAAACATMAAMAAMITAV